MFSVARQFSDEDVKAKFSRLIGNLMGYIARDWIFSLTNKYLDSDM